jgi:outer membrane protein OmpU
MNKQQRRIMDKLKKIGLSALAGSLVAVSANAGEMSVSGSFGMTYSTQSGDTDGINDTYDVSGANPNQGQGIGNDKDFSVSGSGELDNGWTFSGGTLLTDAMGLSSSSLTLTMGSLGSVMVGNTTGGNSTKYDVQTPTAYEEVDDGGALSLSANYVGSWMDGNSLVYGSPSFDLMAGMTATVHVEYAVEASDAATVDGGVSSDTTYDGGKSLGVTLAGNGLTIGVYGAERERTNTGETANFTNDVFAGVYYINYAMGPVSVGYSNSYYDSGLDGAADATTVAKNVGVAEGIFETETYSIAFNVNDNLSVSYAKAEDTYDAQAAGSEAATVINDVTMDMKSIQAAYSMGAMSIKAYRTETDNAEYQTNGGSLTVTEVALGLAF